MSAPLPLHAATADEPIPSFCEDGPWNCPDMREATPIDAMLAELACLTGDPAAYVAQLLAFVAETGCSFMPHYLRDGELVLTAGYPCDPQARHRNRWMHFLIDDLDAQPGRRDLLLAFLVDEGVVWDERPAPASEVTSAVRRLLAAGGRIVIDPSGKLTEGGSIPTHIARCAQRFDKLRGASRAYYQVRSRPGADRRIRRAVKMLGQHESGFTVLEGVEA